MASACGPVTYTGVGEAPTVTETSFFARPGFGGGGVGEAAGAVRAGWKAVGTVPADGTKGIEVAGAACNEGTKADGGGGWKPAGVWK